jgi:hypothetical protein
MHAYTYIHSFFAPRFLHHRASMGQALIQTTVVSPSLSRCVRILSTPAGCAMRALRHATENNLPSPLHTQDETPGLQVFLEGQWVDVPPVKGAFIVNLGPCMQ